MMMVGEIKNKIQQEAFRELHVVWSAQLGLARFMVNELFNQIESNSKLLV